MALGTEERPLVWIAGKKGTHAEVHAAVQPFAYCGKRYSCIALIRLWPRKCPKETASHAGTTPIPNTNAARSMGIAVA